MAFSRPNVSTLRSMTNSDQLFGNYSNIFINPVSGSIELNKFPTELNALHSLINQKNAISNRDEMLVASLKNLGVTHLIDIGCDFGNLINAANKSGIRALGLEIIPTSISLLENAKLNYVEMSIQEFVASPENNLKLRNFLEESGTLAISCLNILHGNWEDCGLRDDLLDKMLSLSQICVITGSSGQIRRLKRRRKIQVIGFLGPRNRAISKSYSELLQYGQFYLLKFWGGRRVESIIYRILIGRFKYTEKISNYLQLVVIISE